MASIGYTANNLMGGTQQNISTGVTLFNSQIVRLNVPAATGKRFLIWELDFGQSGPPNSTDCSVQWQLLQFDATAAGTATTVTALPTYGYITAGNTDVAVTVAKVNYTVAATANLAAATFYAKAINQRGAGFWQAAPGGEFLFPILASTGPLFCAFSATYASTVIARMNFSEI